MVKIKSNSGNTGIDIVISIGIITITLTILAALYFSLYISNAELERRTQAINYATQILEKASEYYYADVNTDNFQVQTLENGKKEIAGIEISKGYEVTVNIEPYSENEQSDVVKNVEVTVKYNVSKKEDTITLSLYKTKETLIIPNIPELGENLVAIRSQKSNNTTTYKLTNSSDAQWYNFNKKIWPLAISKEKTGSSIQTEDLYVWIPRYAYYIDSSNNINIQFLYSNKDKTVDTLGNLQDISSDYIIDDEFTGDNAKGYWLPVSQISLDETANRLNQSEYGNLIY